MSTHIYLQIEEALGIAPSKPFDIPTEIPEDATLAPWAWNKGKPMSEEQRKLVSASRKGQPCNNRINPHAADNGRKGALKLSKTATGRRKVIRNGKSTWAYPSDSDYPV